MPVKFLDKLRHHKAYRYVTRTLAAAAAILAVSVVTTVTVDLGPLVRERAETLGRNTWKRPIHIGGLSIRLLTGRIQVDNFSIEGLQPDDRPFFTARRLDVALDWSTAFNREITITAVDMTDWQMLVEKWDNRNNFPKFTNDADQPPGPRRFTTTLKYLRAWRGQFTFDDHEAPWSVVARNIDVNISNLPKYHGTATFTDGTVAIQHYVPFSAKMRASFVIDEGRIHLDRIEFDTDGAKTVATGVVDVRHWPEQTYQFKSRVQFPRMRQLFFKDEKWELAGDGDVSGTFHLFKNGRDLAATFASSALGVNEYRFPGLYGSVHWTPTDLDVTNAGARVFGGDGRFTYSIRPLGARARPIARFAANFTAVDLASFTDFQQLKGLRFAGTATGERVLLEWPLGRFSEHRGSGHLVVTPPAGVQPMTAALAAPSGARSSADRPLHEWGPFAPVPLVRHLPIAADLTYRFDPEQVDFAPSRFATEHTDVTFEGSTAWGDRARLAFHVTSNDWQESDQVLAGIMTDFGAPTGPVTFGGRGEFDGTMTGSFRRPRVEGEFSGEDLRGFDTWWGAGDAHIVVENGYVRVRDGIVRMNESEMRFDGLFSLGFPRDDGGEEMNARIRVVRRDVDSLRHAFGIDEYPVSGLLSGEFQLTGEYLRPVGFGGMTLDELWSRTASRCKRRPHQCRFGTGVPPRQLTVEKAAHDHRGRVRRMGLDLFRSTSTAAVPLRRCPS